MPLQLQPHAGTVAADVPIKFGTDGWRAIIAEDFTFANARLVANAFDLLKVYGAGWLGCGVAGG